MTEKTLQFGDEGEELVPGKTENLSSALHQASQKKLDAHLGGDEADEQERFDRDGEEPADTDRRPG